MRNMNLDMLRIEKLFVNARASLNRYEDELVDESLENRPVLDTNEPKTPHSLMEPEFERGNTPPKTRPRSSEELLNDGPIALRRRVEEPPQQLDLTPGELRADQGRPKSRFLRRSVNRSWTSIYHRMLGKFSKCPRPQAETEPCSVWRYRFSMFLCRKWRNSWWKCRRPFPKTESSSGLWSRPFLLLHLLR